MKDIILVLAVLVGIALLIGLLLLIGYISSLYIKAFKNKDTNSLILAVKWTLGVLLFGIFVIYKDEIDEFYEITMEENPLYIILLLTVFYRVYLIIAEKRAINKTIHFYNILNQKFDSAKHKMLYEQNDDYLDIDEENFKISKKGITQLSINFAFDEIKIKAIKHLKTKIEIP